MTGRAAMILVLSPAKSLAMDRPPPCPAQAPPAFMDEAAELVAVMRTFSPQALSALMAISPALAQLNADRFAHWQREPSPAACQPALFAFDGDVYDGLQARTLTPPQIAWAQQHVRILSGLYGLLRPLDAMQAYRLEMGTRLATARCRKLTDFWGDAIVQALHAHWRDLGEDAPVLLNLASDEYFAAVERPALKARVVRCVFEDRQGERYRVVSFYAKKARGRMARWVIERGVREVEAVQAFEEDAYRWCPEASEGDRWVFRRDAPRPAGARA